MMMRVLTTLVIASAGVPARKNLGRRPSLGSEAAGEDV
jgi:hypothetical protein